LIPYLQGAHDNEHVRSVHYDRQQTSAVQSKARDEHIRSSLWTDDAKILMNDDGAMA
jgi:hypothetical protein